MKEQHDSVVTFDRAPAKASTVARWVVQVRARHGRGYMAQVADHLRFHFGIQRVDPLEYYLFRLYEAERRADARARPYIGVKARRALAMRLNSPFWGALVDDKLACHAHFSALGYAQAGLRALHHPFRTHGSLAALRDPAALAGFLRTEAHYPFFGKPIVETNGTGVLAAKSLDVAADALVLPSGRRFPVGEYVKAVARFRAGYAFFDLLVPHPAIAELCGPRLSTLRLVVLRDGTQVDVQAAIWKIAVGDNMADNYALPGNAMAAVDPETGAVVRAVKGGGPDEVVLDRHPDTGRPLTGFRLPDFAAARALCLEASRSLPGLQWQAWDIALTPAGPAIVEVNGAGGLTIVQHALGHGLMTERFARLLRSRGPRRVLR